MSFQSLGFIFFLLLFFVLYWNIPHRFRWALILAAGYIFYASWSAAYVLLLLGVTLISYIMAAWIEKEVKKEKRKLLLITLLILEIGLLILFKYLGFFSEILNGLLGGLQLTIRVRALEILLPVGISFYIFQTMAYVIDVYNGKITAETHLGYYAAGVAFFPILLSGPIERLQNLLSQFKADKKFIEKDARIFFQRILMGYLKKIIIADSLAVYVNQVYRNIYNCSGVDFFLVVIFYSIEIYCDFSGYSDIAIGIAGLLGIRLHPNFERPYFADSIKDFWKRWHISLTTWFRDYVYIPLGGNRVAKWKEDRNVLITFLLSGLWHGANWTFIFWGVLHGFMQVAKKKLKNIHGKFTLPKMVKQSGVFLLVSVAWVFFRSGTIGEAFYILGHCFTGSGNNMADLPWSTIQMVLLFLFMVFVFLFERKEEKGQIPFLNNLQLIVMVEISFFYYMRYGTDGSAFIYFQF